MRGENFYRGLLRILNEKFAGLEFLANAWEKTSGLTRFSKSRIHQNVYEEEITLTVLVTKDNKIAVGTTNDLSTGSLERLRENLEEILKNTEELGYKFRLPSPRMDYPYEKVAESVKKATSEDRAKIFDGIVKLAEGTDVYGYIETSLDEFCVMSSNGLYLYTCVSSSSFNTVVMCEDGSGYTSGSSWDLKELDWEEKVKKAVETAKRSRKPVDIDPGKYTVILSPEAVSEIVQYFTHFAANGYYHETKTSPSIRFLGKKIGPDDLNIADDPNYPGQIPLVFDMCGMKRESFPIVEKGVFKNLMYAYGTALKFSKKPTPHTITLDNLDVPYPFNLVIEPGETSLEDLLRSVDRGLWITRFHYVNLVDPMNAVFTGMTRDGTFLIEKGEVTKPVKNMRFNIGFFDMTNNISGISKECSAVATEYTPIIAPYVKVEDFNFTSKSDH